jgi:hypothetical protein
MNTTDILQFYDTLPAHVISVLKEYEKPLTQNIFFLNKEYIIKNQFTRRIKFNKNRWERRPYLFCYDVYSPEEQYLFPMILTINTIKSIHGFVHQKMDVILKPSINTIHKVLNFKQGV